MKVLLSNLLFIFICGSALSQTDQKYVRKGNRDYDDGKYPEAEINYRKALEENPGSFKAVFNLGNSIYKQENYPAAAGHYGTLAEKPSNSGEASKYYYNLGNSFFKSGKYKESATAYKNALLNDPSDMDAKHNLQMALRMLNKQQQEQSGEGQQDQQDQQEQQQQENPQNSGDQNAQENSDGDEQEDPREQAQQIPGQISKEDAERLLQTLENEEKEVLNRVQDQKGRREEIPVEKNW